MKDIKCNSIPNKDTLSYNVNLWENKIWYKKVQFRATLEDTYDGCACAVASPDLQKNI